MVWGSNEVSGCEKELPVQRGSIRSNYAADVDKFSLNIVKTIE